VAPASPFDRHTPASNVRGPRNIAYIQIFPLHTNRSFSKLQTRVLKQPLHPLFVDSQIRCAPLCCAGVATAAFPVDLAIIMGARSA